MALIISKTNMQFHEASTGAPFDQLYCRLSISAHESGLKVSARLRPFASQTAFQNEAPPLELQETADIEWHKSFDVAGMHEQTPENAHLLYKAYLESEQGGEYNVSIV